MLFKLEDYQETTVQFGLKNPYCIYALGCGLGKTLAALETWQRLGRPPMLIVVPGYLRVNWKMEIDKFFPNTDVTIFKSSKDIYPVWDTEIVIISFDVVHKAECLFEWADIVVADEAHSLKTMTSRRTEFFHQHIYENRIKRLLLLTGTPLVNQVLEFYSLIALMWYNPEIKDPLFIHKYPSYVDFAEQFSFRREYTVPTKRGKRKVVKYVGLRNKAELKTYLRDCYIRFGDESLTLPDTKTIDYYISDKDDPKLWEAFSSFTSENSGTSSDIKREAAMAKVPFTIKYIKGMREENESLGKIVVYTDHVASCEALAEALGVPFIHGGVSMDNRAKIADRFIRGDLDSIVATMGSFSTGVNLVVSNNMFFNDFPWVPGTLHQAMYRIKRKGQTKTCYFHRILGSPQDASILQVMEEKMEVIKEFQ